MKLTIDTKEDSHDDLRKVIKMLQHIVGDAEVFTNQPSILPGQSAEQSSPIANIFGDTSSSLAAENSSAAAPSAEASVSITPATEEVPQSTEDLFAELFNEEELKKMDVKKEDDEENLDLKKKDKKYDIEFY